jgi:hypothetical protein
MLVDAGTGGIRARWWLVGRLALDRAAGGTGRGGWRRGTARNGGRAASDRATRG